ncbi:MAG: DNA gyrase subunit A [Candidatus Latescibacteria bacterium ADurb.Bin168]|nr:MAG: DNA gyrase subunit A [Candidatus Latescibacteria bacterium ADurb.Bin168]
MLESRERVIPIQIEEEIRESYMEYALSTLVARALPDVRDGLKPSQRRILVAMNDLHLGPTAKYYKCAKVAGDTSGNYHPHGEAIVYPTLYRMAQPFNMRYRLVDGQGNFGSIDGDPPAAMRYTECRMTSVATELLADLDRDTVDFQSNYDERLQEPKVLPARFPALLCNGASGIAVGMATNIPPHNVGEVVDALIAQIENPDIDVNGLMQHIKGPDFPTGAIIYGIEGIREAYATGRGLIKVRARANIETLKNDRQNIVITEIPFQLNATTLKEAIASVARNRVVDGIADFRDESDRDGMRMVIELKRDAYAEVTLNQLFKHTPLEQTFGINLLALVNGQPKLLTLKEMLQHYIDHRREVVRRRTSFDLNQAQAQAHIVEGLLLALRDIDNIIETIRKSRDAAEARGQLMNVFQLSEKQADAILDMNLRRLTSLEVNKLENQYADLTAQIAEFQTILSSDANILAVVKKELLDVRKKHGDERRTEIVASASDFSIEDLIAEEDMVVTISHTGYIKRIPINTYRQQRRGGRGVTGMTTKEEDFVEHLFVASTHSYLLCLTEKGRCYRLRVHEIPQGSRSSKGRPLVNVLEAAKDEIIAAVVPVRHFEEGRYLVMVTANGTIKKTPLSAFANINRLGVIAINVLEEDELIEAAVTDGTYDIILGTRNGYAIRFPEDTVRPMGRTAAGVRGIRLRGDDRVVGMVVNKHHDRTLLTVCENGHGKRSPIEDYRITNRGGKGIINIKATERNGAVVAIKEVIDEDELMIVTQNGILIRLPIADLSVIGRNTQGVRLIRIEEGDVVQDVARVVVKNGDAGAVSPEGEAEELEQDSEEIANGLPDEEYRGDSESQEDEEDDGGDHVDLADEEE